MNRDQDADLVPDLDRHQNGKSDPDRHKNDARSTTLGQCIAKKTAGSYSPVPVDGEVRGGVGQGLQVGGGAPPVLPGVQSGHAHSNLTQGSCQKEGFFGFFLFMYDI